MHRRTAIFLSSVVTVTGIGGCTFTNTLDDLVGPAQGGAGGAAGSAGAGAVAGAGGGSGGIPGVSAKAPLRRIAAGGSHVCIVDSTDRVFCWGSNSNGQLGTGGPADGVIKPTRVEGVSNASIVVAGNFHTCAFGPSGDWCWGKGSQGELGIGKLESRGTPTSITIGGTDVVKAAAAGAAHTCVVVDSDVVCWGSNTSFQSSTTGLPSNVPAPKKTIQTGQFSVAAGAAHTCTAPATGTAQCWGENEDGQLGIGTQSDSFAPKPITLSSDVSQLSSRSKHTCAIAKGGDLYCWGLNSAGQVGNGNTTATVPSPTKVSLGGGNFKPTRVAAGSDHTCATQTGKAYCWGGNAKGQLGTGNTTAVSTPTEVKLPAGTIVFDIAAGISFTCALTLPQGSSQAESVHCWGNNASGQVGKAISASEPTPVEVTL